MRNKESEFRIELRVRQQALEHEAYRLELLCAGAPNSVRQTDADILAEAAEMVGRAIQRVETLIYLVERGET